MSQNRWVECIAIFIVDDGWKRVVVVVVHQWMGKVLQGEIDIWWSNIYYYPLLFTHIWLFLWSSLLLIWKYDFYLLTVDRKGWVVLVVHNRWGNCWYLILYCLLLYKLIYGVTNRDMACKCTDNSVSCIHTNISCNWIGVID